MTTSHHAKDASSGKRVVKVPRSVIAGAQLQVAMEKRLGIDTPEVIKKIAQAQ